jgi:cholesterol oxidase
MAASRFDVIVVGSGFGGSVMACRLAERGARVLVLERGRSWHPAEYPRAAGDPWIWDHRKPEHLNGWLDFRWFGGMGVAQGAGVGGGSLIFANVVVDARPSLFASGWPSEITFQELRPFYDRVARMLGAATLPEGQRTDRFKLLEEAARATGNEARFRALPLAVTFDPEWNHNLTDASHGKHSKPWMNAEGHLQGTCVHCGNCDIGCQVRAKNTLDLNYIPRAIRHGAQVRALCLVTAIAPAEGGYRVHYDRLVGGERVPESEWVPRVVLAAGSLGSTELLLRSRDALGTLPNVSAHLGRGWSSNADFLTPARYRERTVSPTYGPTITCAVDFLDGSVDGEQFFIEDGGFPNLPLTFAEPTSPRGRRTTLLGAALQRASQGIGARNSVALARLNPAMNRETRWLGRLMGTGDPLKSMMPWFAQGVDAADGRLYLGRSWRRPREKTLKLDWRVQRSRGVIDAIVGMHRRFSEATGGELRVPMTWSLLRSLVTPHPLGGCNMGTTRADGVVDHRGEVFGYPGLYVADGAIIPRAIGVNPSKTIAALAERSAALFDL